MQGKKICEEKGIKIETTCLNDGLHIKWENKNPRNGILKIYRKEGNFSSDKFNETQNGVLVVDDELTQGKKGETFDYLEQEKNYSYTVNG